VIEDVAVTRGGPKRPVDRVPAREPGSVRRTTTIDSARPDGIEGDVQVAARARDLRTAADGSPDVLAAESFDAVVGRDRSLKRIDHPDERLAGLLGVPVAGGFRAKALAVVPDEAERGSLLNQLLDDLPGAELVAGVALQHDPSWHQVRLSVDHLAGATDQCAGWVAGGTILHAVEIGGLVPTPTAPPVADPGDDPHAWHERPVLPAGATRRARRLDLAPDGRFSAHFRDSYVSAEGEGAVHEYSLWGRFDLAAGVVVDLQAEAHVLPWVECPGALASAQRVVGLAAGDLRAVVRRDFVGTSTCTHLNDTLRALADLPALAAAL
jgi:hypothetical protein